MRKYNKKNKVRGLKSSDKMPVVVRWLGAYGSVDDVEKMASFEKKPGRAVSAEVLKNGWSKSKK